MNRLLLATLLAALPVSTLAAHADVIPYNNPGHAVPQETITAEANFDVTGYFVQGGSLSGGAAGDTDFIVMLDKTTGIKSAPLFDNQTSNAGDIADFGTVAKGDVLVFELVNTSLGETFASDTSLSDDGVNHAYVTGFSGGTLNGVNLPAGVYVGMEDLPSSSSDFNYTDDTFVFTNVASTPASVTPEPSSLMLLGSGILGLAGAVRRRVRR